MVPAAILRCVMRLGDEPEGELAANLMALVQDITLEGIDRDLIDFVVDLHDRARAVPALNLVYQHFQRLATEGDGRGAAAVARLDSILHPAKPLAFLSAANFRFSLDLYRKEVMRESTSRILIEASTILTSGTQRRVQRDGRWDTTTVQGPEAALDYLNESITVLNAQTRRGSVEGDFRAEGEKVRRQYRQWRENPEMRVGVLSGLTKIDAVHRGLKNGELGLVLGFVSHLKSSFVLNWLYKAAIWYGKHVAIASLETPNEVLRTLLYTIHSGHARFADRGFPCIDHEKILTGSLNPDEEQFYDDVIDDLQHNPAYGAIYYMEPQSSVTISHIQHWAESKHRVTPLSLLVIDYLGLVDPEKGSSLEQSSKLNMVIRAAKLMATTFDGGRGIPVLSPFQSNRDGLKEAEKNGGRYKLTALSTANESERSADLVYYVYLSDQLRASKELIVGNLKNRNGPVILEQFPVFADPASRIIENLDIGGTPRQQPVDRNQVEEPRPEDYV